MSLKLGGLLIQTAGPSLPLAGVGIFLLPPLTAFARKRLAYPRHQVKKRGNHMIAFAPAPRTTL